VLVLETTIGVLDVVYTGALDVVYWTALLELVETAEAGAAAEVLLELTFITVLLEELVLAGLVLVVDQPVEAA